jgi:hypothetical protein
LSRDLEEQIKVEQGEQLADKWTALQADLAAVTAEKKGLAARLRILIK